MKRKFQLGLVLVTVLLCITGINVFASSEADFEFDESTGTITKYVGAGGDVVIPSKINRVCVTSIGDDAFLFSSLTSITIPESVTSIGGSTFVIPDSVNSIEDSAFRYCSGLTSIMVEDNNPNYSSINGVLFNKDKTNIIQYPNGISNQIYIIPDSVNGISNQIYTIPDSVTSIGDFAFWNCRGLTGITIPDSVTSIGDSAFGSCSSLTSITIPDSVTSIGDSAFRHCSGLTSITVEDNNSNYSSIDGVLFNQYKTNIIHYPNSISNQIYTIPDSVTSIGNYTFEGCISLTGITIPDSVTSIGNSAFLNCSSLTRITIPESVTSIGDDAFRYCRGLTSITVEDNNSNYSSVDGVLFNQDKTNIIYYPNSISNQIYTIPDSVTSIGDYAFLFSSLTSITIPDSVTSIGDSVFWGCSGLTGIIIPDSVTSIGDYAFRYCSLTSITIPDSVISIGDSAFKECSRLTSIKVEDSNPNYSSINGVLFNKDKTNIIHYPNGISNQIYKIPDSVTSIGDYAFGDCSSLTSITIPDSVTSIGDSAFFYCSSLTSITIPSSVTSIGVSVFYNCSNLISITIPSSVTSIGDSAFYNCSNLTIHCNKGSFAHTYSQKYNKPFKILINVILDNKKLEFDVLPTIISGRTLVPLRKIFETLGANVEWDGTTRTVTVTKCSTTIEVKIDDTFTKVNGKTVEIDVPATIINGRTLVPVRFISESFGCKVDWDGVTKTVIIKS